MKKALVLSFILLMVPSCKNWFSSETTQGSATETADKSAVTQEKLQKLNTQIAVYKEKLGVLPGDLKELVDGPKDESLRTKWTEALVTEVDIVDAWGQPFMYTVSAADATAPYELFSVGEKTEIKEEKE
jgi:hypothetical protein